MNLHVNWSFVSLFDISSGVIVFICRERRGEKDIVISIISEKKGSKQEAQAKFHLKKTYFKESSFRLLTQIYPVDYRGVVL